MRSTTNYSSLPYNKDLLKRARELRKAGILHEVLFWNRVKHKKLNGLDFDRQKVIGNYIVDFFCSERLVVIELDGESHLGRGGYDVSRHQFLEGLGLTVIHIDVSEVFKDLDAVIASLADHPALSGTPPQRGIDADLSPPSE